VLWHNIARTQNALNDLPRWQSGAAVQRHMQHQLQALQPACLTDTWCRGTQHKLAFQTLLKLSGCANDTRPL
jgi:hypothetical protein